MRDLERWIRAVPDWPSAGVTFRDITPLLAHGFNDALDALDEAIGDWGHIDAFAGVESRGFIFAAPLAARRGISFVPIRKAGKLPADVVAREYALEYGTATLEMHTDAVPAGARVVVVDDVLATGGTLEAAEALVGDIGATVVGHLVLVELLGLGGRARLGNVPLASVLTY